MTLRQLRARTRAAMWRWIVFWCLFAGALAILERLT